MHRRARLADPPGEGLRPSWIGPRTQRAPRVLLWGDSNAAHYVGSLGAVARQLGFAFFNLAHSACPPLLEDPTPFISARYRASCRASLQTVQPLFDDFSVIVMSAAWSTYQGADTRFMSAVMRTAQKLVERDKKLVLVGKAPRFSDYDRLCAKKALAFPGMVCETRRIALPSAIARANSTLQAFAQRTDGVEYLDFNSVLCEGGTCSPFAQDGYPLYFDPSHLSMVGSWRVGRAFLQKGRAPSFLELWLARH